MDEGDGQLTHAYCPPEISSGSAPTLEIQVLRANPFAVASNRLPASVGMFIEPADWNGKLASSDAVPRNASPPMRAWLLSAAGKGGVASSWT
ncbi:hypothetical protein N9L68_02140 [bacterium]|nr:hypothetical protein [bacterium]